MGMATVIVVGVIIAHMVIGVTIFKIISIQEKKKRKKKERKVWCTGVIIVACIVIQ